MAGFLFLGISRHTKLQRQAFESWKKNTFFILMDALVFRILIIE